MTRLLRWPWESVWQVMDNYRVYVDGEPYPMRKWRTIRAADITPMHRMGMYKTRLVSRWRTWI